MKRSRNILRAVAACILLCVLCTLLCSCLSERSLRTAYVNDNGELILTYSDGTSENLGVVKGADGKDGVNGQDGADGQDGEDGQDGQPGRDGERGEKGSTGDKGADGRDGRDGTLTIVSDSASIAEATARGLRSTVSIYCEFPAGTSAGAGVIWKLDDEGNALIVTNHHVVYHSGTRQNGGISQDIEVLLYGGEYTDLAIEATYLGGSMYYDIAVLSVRESDVLKNSDAVAATVADSDGVHVGDRAIAIGNPQGAGISASFGVVSVDSEEIDMLVGNNRRVTMRVMRMDTAVNSGNSGGGLFNAAGELCGIVNAKIVSEDVENMAYAIPSNLAIAVAQSIVDHCDGNNARNMKRVMLGADLSLLDSYAEMDADGGYMRIVQEVGISSVEAGGLVDGTLEVGDRIVSVTLGTRTVMVTREHHLTNLLLDARAGDTLTFTIMRDDVTMQKQIVITEADMIEY